MELSEQKAATRIWSNTSSFVTRHADIMFKMYQHTYSAAGQDLWFKSPADMFKYPCSVVASSHTSNANPIQAFLMFQRRKFANKISLFVHDGTREGKTTAFTMLAKLLKTPGWILEASGALSWVLRKQGTSIISSGVQIRTLLEIDPHKEKIVMNHKFDHKDKRSFQYAHEYGDNGQSLFVNQETLFGVGGCSYKKKDNTCDRICRQKISLLPRRRSRQSSAPLLRRRLSRSSTRAPRQRSRQSSAGSLRRRSRQSSAESLRRRSG